MTHAPDTPHTVIRTPPAFLPWDGGVYGNDTIRRHDRFGFHLTIGEPGRARRTDEASIICGRPVDQAWDDNQTLFFVLAARTDTARALLIAAAWDHAAPLGYRRMAGCLGRHRCSSTNSHPHRGDDDCPCDLDLRPCALVIPDPAPPHHVPRAQPLAGISRPLTAQLWEHRLALRGPQLTYTDLHGVDPDAWSEGYGI